MRGWGNLHVCYHTGNGKILINTRDKSYQAAKHKVVVSDTCDSILRERHVHTYSHTYSHSYKIDIVL